MFESNLANLTTQYQQAYLVYCYKVMQYLQALVWLTEQKEPKNQTNIIEVKPKSASGVKKSAQTPNQEKPALKSLKHLEKLNVSTIVALGFPNGAMSAAFRVAFNDILEDAWNSAKHTVETAGKVLDAAGPIVIDRNTAGELIGANDIARCLMGNCDPIALAMMVVPPLKVVSKVLPKGNKFFNMFKKNNPYDHNIRELGRFTEFSVKVPGNKSGYTNWVKILNQDAKTIKLYHDTFDGTGMFLHRSIKLPSPNRHIYRDGFTRID